MKDEPRKDTVHGRMSAAIRRAESVVTIVVTPAPVTIQLRYAEVPGDEQVLRAAKRRAGQQILRKCQELPATITDRA